MEMTDMARRPPPSSSHSRPGIIHVRYQRHEGHQTLRCPHCKADIHLLQLESQPESEHSTKAASSLPESSESSESSESRRIDERDAPEPAKLDELKGLICSPGKNLQVKPGARYPRTLRPVNDPTDDILTRVALRMQAAIRHAGEASADALLRSQLKRGIHHFGQRLRPEHVFRAVGGILYDQEWTGNPSLGMTPDDIALDDTGMDVEFACNYAFEMMLLVDYGFQRRPVRKPWLYWREAFIDLIWTRFEHFSRVLTAVARRWNEGDLPDPAAWVCIAREMGNFGWSGLDVSDAATLIYYYHTRREPVNSESAKRGWTGYTGVLQEMITEVPIRGTGRLARKLSLDINLLIPKYVSDREERELMLCKARRLVQEHNLSVLDTGSQEERGWLESVGNWFSFSDKETVAEKEKQS